MRSKSTSRAGVSSDWIGSPGATVGDGSRGELVGFITSWKRTDDFHRRIVASSEIGPRPAFFLLNPIFHKPNLLFINGRLVGKEIMTRHAVRTVLCCPICGRSDIVPVPDLYKFTAERVEHGEGPESHESGRVGLAVFYCEQYGHLFFVRTRDLHEAGPLL
jgi:hypothetical protein